MKILYFTQQVLIEFVYFVGTTKICKACGVETRNPSRSLRTEKQEVCMRV
jgi:hypothetical protein